MFLHKDVQHAAILIDGTPEVMRLTADYDEDLIHEPSIAQTPKAASKSSGEDPAKLEAPLADSLVAHNDTHEQTSTSGREVKDDS